MKIIFLLKTLITIFFIIFSKLSYSNEYNVNKIIIEGEKRFSEALILKYLPTIENDIVNDDFLNTLTKNLYQTGFFLDVQVEINDNTIVIKVEEYPIVNQISFIGNDLLDNDQLVSILNIKSRDTFNKQSIDNSIENIRTAYQKIGRYLAQIDVKKNILSDGRVDLIFEIKEGSLLLVKNINFIGNKIFSDNDLKLVITTKEDAWYKLFASNKFIPSKLEYDKEKLYYFYKQRGYIDFKIILARGDLLPDYSGFNINFIVEEGLRFKINNIKITSNLNENKYNVDSLLIKKDEYFDSRALEKSVTDLRDYYSELGYGFIKVSPKLSKKNNLVDILFTINEGNKNFINKIFVQGNSRTSDSIIRRELTFLEGDSFNNAKIKESINALNRLGFFQSVKYNVRKTEITNAVDIIINVEETNTGSISFGIGYSSLDGTGFNFGLNEKNFLGEGRRARLELSTSAKKTTYNVGMTEPYFMDRPISLSSDIYNQETENSAGDVKSERSGISFGLGVKEDLKFHSLSYNLSESQTTTSATSSALSSTGEEGVNIVTSSFKYLIKEDTRDNYFNPTSGYSWNITNTFAGIGGDSNFIKSQASYKVYHPLVYGEYIVGFKSALGFVSSLDKKITSSNRFSLGGKTLRGFENAGVGPRDTGNNQVVGGNNFYNMSLEIRSEKFMPDDTGFQWLAFVDAGSLWGTDFEANVKGYDDMEPRITSGLGLAISTPIGPLQAIWGFPIASQAYDVNENFQFSIGTSF
ncbi:outer membrane protein assembly factor BamA [Alphaproteobacteria bacterium]|nr:outer membrane protein assembly factor BamA [Alphaproteobacteria bacterium]